MMLLLTIFHVLLAGGVGLLVLVQAFRQRTDLISLRNFFLLGFVIFQLISAALSFRTGDFGDFPVFNPSTTGLIYSALISVFLFVFLLTYRLGWIAKGLAWRTPIRPVIPNDIAMLILAVVIVLVGGLLRLLAQGAPVETIGGGFAAVFAEIVGVTFLAAATGIAGWVWAPRALNPLIAGIAGGIVVFALAVLLFKAFGRRDLLAVLMAFGWGAYHGYWKRLGPKAALFRFVAAGMIGLVFLAMFTAGRSGRERNRSIGQTIAAMQQANFKEGLVALTTGQFAAANSMYFIESRPHVFEYDTFHTVRYVLGHPIPRAIWAGKPNALARDAPVQARIRGKRANYSIGPGIIGHIANDNPWLTLLPYAIFLALLLRYADEMVWLHPSNPFVVLPIGVSLGQIIALPRGELGLFLFWGVASIVMAAMFMFVASRLLGVLGLEVYELSVADDDEFGHADDEYHTGAA
ncbi:MAG: hypothetical protein IIB55_03755 [Planctomycetes bacterium]|nr:hypothetical protein [Planctomycetota bacterium]